MDDFNVNLAHRAVIIMNIDKGNDFGTELFSYKLDIYKKEYDFNEKQRRTQGEKDRI